MKNDMMYAYDKLNCSCYIPTKPCLEEGDFPKSQLSKTEDNNKRQSLPNFSWEARMSHRMQLYFSPPSTFYFESNILKWAEEAELGSSLLTNLTFSPMTIKIIQRKGTMPAVIWKTSWTHENSYKGLFVILVSFELRDPWLL